MDAYRDFSTGLFRAPWKVRNLAKLLTEMWEPLRQSWAEMSRTLTSLTDGADLLLSSNVGFEMQAANVAEYYDIPLATLHWYPMRPNGHSRHFCPHRCAARGWRCMTGHPGVDGDASSSRSSAANSAFHRPGDPGRGGSSSGGHWRSRPMTRSASRVWRPNGRSGGINDRSSVR